MDKKTKALMVDWEASDEIKQGCAKAVKGLFKNPAAVALGRLGGRAGRGASKARPGWQMRLAISKRWAIYRENKRKEQQEKGQ